MAKTIDMIAFRKVLNEARDAYKTANSESMRDWICEQVARFVHCALTAQECLQEIHAIQAILNEIDHPAQSVADYLKGVTSAVEE